MSTRFFYVRNIDTWHPVGCIAYQTKYNSSDDSLSVSFEVSTHNPHDKWNKKRAREIAVGRLNKSPMKISGLFNKAEVHSALLETISNDETVPLRLQKHASKMLELIKETEKLKNELFAEAEVFSNSGIDDSDDIPF